MIILTCGGQIKYYKYGGKKTLFPSKPCIQKHSYFMCFVFQLVRKWTWTLQRQRTWRHDQIKKKKLYKHYLYTRHQERNNLFYCQISRPNIFYLIKNLCGLGGFLGCRFHSCSLFPFLFLVSVVTYKEK